MENNKSYLPLIVEWEKYLEISDKSDVKDFAFWILEKEKISESHLEKEGDLPLAGYFNEQSEKHQYAYKSPEAAFLIWRLSKFIRFYTKPVLLENGLASQDDFAILAELDYKKTCSKKEAIDANIIDSTTGIEIIKRLVNQGLISEKINKDDKRQKLISLTKKGREVLYAIYVGFSQIQDVMADMKVEQRERLIQTLADLDGFHTRNVEGLSRGVKK